MNRRVLLSLIASFVIATPLLAGPPWITVELPPNPFDPATRGAILLVHAFHYRSDAEQPVTGRAVGVVNGSRREIALRLEKTSRPGAFALKNSWGGKGDWTILLTVAQDHGDAAEAMVKISDNRVIGVEVATGPSRWAEIPFVPRRFTEAEVEASLKR